MKLIPQFLSMVAGSHYEQHVVLVAELCEGRGHDGVLRVAIHIGWVLLNVGQSDRFHLRLDCVPYVVVRLNSWTGYVETAPKKRRDRHKPLLSYRAGCPKQLQYIACLFGQSADKSA